MKYSLICAILAGAALLEPVPARAEVPPAKPTKDKLAAAETRQIAGLLRQFMRANRIPGLSVAVSVNGRIVYATGMGIARQGIKATKDTIYPIGQITQQMTGGAIVLLQQRGHGKIKLRQSIHEYFAGVSHWRRASVGNLLTHTSGIPDLRTSIFYRERIFSRISKQRVLTFIKARDLAFESGRKYQFSDSNYFLLANVVEIALELFFHDYIRSEFYEILLMKRSSFLSEQPPGRRANGYDGKTIARDVNPAILFGSADATSTAVDLQNWNFGLMRTKMFLPVSRRILFNTFVPVPKRRAYYGAGFFVRRGAPWHEYFTEGQIPGFSGINKIFYNPKTGADIYVTILTNQTNVKGLDALSTRIGRIAQ